MFKKGQSRVHDTGFSLIELMVVVAIIAVLAAIALPAYQQYMRNAKISEARAILDALKDQAANYYNVKGDIPSVTQLGFTAGVSSDVTPSPDTADEYLVKPYLAQIQITGENSSPGQCGTIYALGAISNMDGVAATGGGLPVLQINTGYIDTPSGMMPVCYFTDYTVDIPAGDPNTTMAGCVNTNAPDSAAYASTISTLQGSCP